MKLNRFFILLVVTVYFPLAAWIISRQMYTLAPAWSEQSNNNYPATLSYNEGCSTGLYAVSGIITDQANNPITDVVILISNGLSVTNYPSGLYFTPCMEPGTYVLTPSKMSYAFSPTFRVETLPPYQFNQDFTGIPCQIDNVPLLKQSGQSWSGDPYGQNPGPGDTIGKWGCALTSATMIVNYYGQQQNGFSTNPGLLNTWLHDNDGYSGRSIIWQKVADFAATFDVDLYFYGIGIGRQDKVVGGFLCNLSPIILFTTDAPYSNHFLVATGRTDVNNWAVNDPGSYNLTQLPLGSYQGVRKFGAMPTDPSALYIHAHSPVELLITDPLGRRVGYDPDNGTYHSEIPDSSYGLEILGTHDGSGDTDETLVFESTAPLSGQYLLEIIAVGTGEYEIDLIGYDSDGNDSRLSLTGSVTPNDRISVTFNYSTEPGSPISIDRSIYLPYIVK